VIIENDEKVAAEMDPKWLVHIGDAASEKTLREAGIEHALGMVAAASTDATNIYVVLTARGLNPRLKIIARASEDGAEKHLLTAGAFVSYDCYRAVDQAQRNPREDRQRGAALGKCRLEQSSQRERQRDSDHIRPGSRPNQPDCERCKSGTACESLTQGFCGG